MTDTSAAGRQGRDGSTVPRPRTPLWVKVFAAIAAGLLVAFVLLHLTGHGFGGHHGLGHGGP